MPLEFGQWPSANAPAVVFNTEAAWMFLTSDTYRATISPESHIYCDGAGLALYARLRFGRDVQRRHGPDVMHDYLRDARGFDVLLLGGMPRAHAGLRQRYPEFFIHNRVSVDGRMLAADDYPQVAADVAAGGYDHVLIFLGLARQERFQHLLHQAGFAGASIGLGAAVDFLSGTKPRAGLMWQRLGLEWLPRLLREPRMAPRIMRSFGLFGLIWHPRNAELRALVSDAVSDGAAGNPHKSG